MVEPTVADRSTVDDDAPPRTPRWVKVMGIIALIVVLVTVFELVTRGPHRPGMPGMRHGGLAPATSVVVPAGDDGSLR